MTQLELLMEYYSLTLRGLVLEAQEATHEQHLEREPESRQRIALCRQRKAEQLRRAWAAGILTRKEDR